MTTKIIVAAPICTPARTHIKTALQPYGVRFRVVDQYLSDHSGNWTTDPCGAYLLIAHVVVPDAAAKWAEYLMLRSGKLQLISQPLDKRNLKWALKWHGRMPRPWIERGCTWPPTKQRRQPWWRRLFK